MKKSLKAFEETASLMEKFAGLLAQLKRLQISSQLNPEFDVALKKILANHPPVERVSLRSLRYANIARGERVVMQQQTIGRNFDELTANLEEDLTILRKQLGDTIETFRSVIPIAEKGGFAAMVLSGRAAFPEKIMQSLDLTMIYARFYDLACLTTIAATMQIYPKGLDWLQKPPAGVIR